MIRTKNLSAAILCFALGPLFLASCDEEYAFGLSRDRLEKLLEESDTAAFLALEKEELENTGQAGPAAWYYLARWLDAKAPEGDAGQAARDRALELYRLAMESREGIAGREAGIVLVSRFAERAAADASPEKPARWQSLLDAADAVEAVLGPDWQIGRARLDALEALGRWPELLAKVEDLRGRFEKEAAKATDALLYFEGAAARGSGGQAWAPAFRRLFLERPASEWTKRALDMVLRAAEEGEDLPPELSTAVLETARLRVAILDRDYGAALRAIPGSAELAIAPTASRNLIADAAKAFLYSNAEKEGLARFNAAFSKTAEARSPGNGGAGAWAAAFYRARFLKNLGRLDEAAELFSGLAASAPTAEDGDAALWYALDSRVKTTESNGGPVSPENRRASLHALAEAAKSWNSPTFFSDLLDRLLREALLARDFDFVTEFASGLGPRISPTMGARVSYIAGRLLELGLAADPVPGTAADSDQAEPPTMAAADFYRAVLSRAGAPAYYRILAAWRLGEDAAKIPDDLPPPPATAHGELESFLEGFANFGLGGEIYPIVRSRSAELDREALRRLAERLKAANLHADSMRLMVILSDRQDWDPRKADYELLYPRPFLEEYRSIRPHPDLPEHILFGLIRSESFFRPDVESAAGAIGLSQLMPATAAETARKLRLGSYDLRSPQDNLRIGSAHFADLLEESGDRPLRAMFAYNAGRTRLRRWLVDSGDLPDDLLLESLTFEETRQYGRNILEAATIYGELYYRMSASEVVEEMIGPKPALP